MPTRIITDPNDRQRICQMCGHTWELKISSKTGKIREAHRCKNSMCRSTLWRTGLARGTGKEPMVPAKDVARMVLEYLQQKNPAVTDVRMDGEKVIITEDQRKNPSVVVLPHGVFKTFEPGQVQTYKYAPTTWAHEWEAMSAMEPAKRIAKFKELCAGRSLPAEFMKWKQQTRIAWLESEWGAPE